MADETDWKAKYDGVYASLGVLQPQLDAALQKHKDDAAAHETMLKELKDSHATRVNVLVAEHSAAMKEAMTAFEQFKAEAAQTLALLKDQHERALVDLTAELTQRHAAEIAKLKADVLGPAMRDLHARQAADLAAQHAAELAKLN